MRILALGAAVLGSVELGLHRIVVPVLAHVPGAGPGNPLVDGLAWAGDRAFSGTALLVVCGVLTAGIFTVRTNRTLATLVLAAVLVALADAATRSAGVAFAGHALTIAALAAIVAEAARRSTPATRPMFAALVLTALGLCAAQWPLLVDAWSTLLGGTSGANTSLAAWTVAELALVSAPIGFAGALLLTRTPSRVAWGAALAAALLAGAFLGAEPGYAGLISIWATGTTLSLPAFVYVFSATSAALVLASWLSDVSTRHLAAGLVLLAVAGVQPAVVHHNLTAVFALFLLASPALAVATPSGRTAAMPVVSASAALAG